ncbi:MDR family MFS transporter [Paenibacillus sp. 1P07SE]|uniref:MDR family MFS transporter n=1 Tax=Paenibacillus sp. 1P07SE TaxID=3132209 RepID=UPI0039A3FE89
MIAIMAAMFFAAINQTIVSTAMPRIASLLNGMDLYTWVITIYMLTSTIATVLVGKLSDIYGRKPFLLLGIIFFMIGAFLCGTAGTIGQMILYRGIQGVGGGIIMATAITAIGDLFAPRERAKWTGMMMAIFGFSSVLGPTLGGWMVDHMNWEWIFWIFLPIGFIAFAMIWRLFPKPQRNYNEKVDYLGSLFLTTAIIPLLLGFTWAGTQYAWLSWQIIGLFAACLVSIFLFVLVERKVQSPVLPLSLFSNSVVTISNIAGFLMGAGMLGALIYLPFFVQGVEGISPTYSGYVTMPMSIAMIVLSALTGRWMTKSGKYKRFALLGMAIMTVGMVIMAYMDNIPVAIVSMIVFGIGLGLGMPVFTLAAQNAVSPSELGVVTASSQLFRNLGSTIGIAVMGSIMISRMAHNISAAMSNAGASNPAAADPEVMQQLQPFMDPQLLTNQPELERLTASLPDELQSVAMQMVGMMRGALSDALTTVFLTGAGLLVVAFILVVFMREIPLRSSDAPSAESGGERESSGSVSARPSINEM